MEGGINDRESLTGLFNLAFVVSSGFSGLKKGICRIHFCYVRCRFR